MASNVNKTSVLKLDRTDIVPIFLWAAVVFLTWLFMHGAEHFLTLTPSALGKYFGLKWVFNRTYHSRRRRADTWPCTVLA
jgi:hypothetical protein